MHEVNVLKYDTCYMSSPSVAAIVKIGWKWLVERSILPLNIVVFAIAVKLIVQAL
jgi:hypothetical protein